jgi:hypothetical protein
VSRYIAGGPEERGHSRRARGQIVCCAGLSAIGGVRHPFPGCKHRRAACKAPSASRPRFAGCSSGSRSTWPVRDHPAFLTIQLEIAAIFYAVFIGMYSSAPNSTIPQRRARGNRNRIRAHRRRHRGHYHSRADRRRIEIEDDVHDDSNGA